MKLKYDDLLQLLKQALLSASLTESEALIVAEELTFAEARGKTSHGINMLEAMIKRAKKSHTEIVVLKDEPTNTLIDGGGKVGPVVAKYAMDITTQKALENGIAITGVINPSPFMTAGYSAWEAAKTHNLISICMTVAKSKVAPHGTNKAILGTNPIGFGFPAKPHPIILDMAITKIPAAEIKIAEREGKQLPNNVAIDEHGDMTVDPIRALGGALIPFGGYKGSALGVIVELLAGALLNVKCGLRSGEMRSMLFIGIKPNIFSNIDNVIESATKLREDIHLNSCSNESANLPGDRAELLHQIAIKDGLIIEDSIYEKILSYIN